jgi:hypothetical protein
MAPFIENVDWPSAWQNTITIPTPSSLDLFNADIVSSRDEITFLLMALYLGFDIASRYAEHCGWQCTALIARIAALLESTSLSGSTANNGGAA